MGIDYWVLDWIGLLLCCCCVGGVIEFICWRSIFFLLIHALFNANAEDYHEQQNYLKQDRRSVAGGFKRAARHFHVIVKIRVAVVVIRVHVWGCWLTWIN